MDKSRDIKEFLKDIGYETQEALAKVLVEKGIYKNLSGTKSIISGVINGNRTIPKKLIKGLEGISINADKFLEIRDLINPKKHTKMKSYLEKEFKEKYNLFEKHFIDEKDIYVQMGMLLDFNEVVKKYTKKK